MAQKIQMLFIDDLDGSQAAGTVQFGLDGTAYEIDLSTAHSAELHQALKPYIQRGRKVASSARSATRTRRRGNGVDGLDTTAVRSWAKDQGLAINARGRVPADVVAKYRAATGQ
jgi:hypothetical protein